MKNTPLHDDFTCKKIFKKAPKKAFFYNSHAKTIFFNFYCSKKTSFYPPKTQFLHDFAQTLIKNVM